MKTEAEVALKDAEETHSRLIDSIYKMEYFQYLDYVYEYWAVGSLEGVDHYRELFISKLDGRGRIWTQLFVLEATIMNLTHKVYMDHNAEDKDGYVLWYGGGEAFEMHFGMWSKHMGHNEFVELNEAMDRAHP